jgi:hypothetical protein
MCCNPAKGRVEFEDGWFIKPSFITKDEMKACQLTKNRNPKKKKKKKEGIILFLGFACYKRLRSTDPNKIVSVTNRPTK